MSTLEIHTTRIADGVHTYSFTADGQELGLPEAFRSEVAIEAGLERRGRQYRVDARVATSGTFTCDRCLAPFEREVTGEFNVLFVSDGTSVPEDLPDDELRVIPSESMVIELDEDVRQCATLAVPVKLVCREECLGLCPTCGKNLNDGQCGCENEDTDPRWEPLKKLSRS